MSAVRRRNAETNRSQERTPLRSRPTRTSRADAALARTILDSPMDFVDDEAFHARDARRRIYDRADDVPLPDTSWYRPLIDDVIGKRPEGTSTRSSVVLTGAQEQIIFLQYNYARFQVSKLQERIGHRTPTPKQTSDLISWYRCSRKLRDQIAETNLALVLAMAKRVRLKDVDFGDQISEGNMALLRAVDKFDASRGFKFSTYACRAILKSFSRQGMKSTRYRQRFPTGFDPSLESSNYPEERRQQDQKEQADEVKQIVLENAADLTDIEQEILHHRFGFDAGRNGKPLTLAQVGKIIGLTKERVRQIQNRALLKLRQAVETRCLPRSEREEIENGSWRISPN
ncbi:MAG: sigma-70 family RNA polymerase sigma factor [Phycisphaerales bacterium]|nr:sigma-70 family RNA polymerase sigma factor [Phycisphaerales bacterium]